MPANAGIQAAAEKRDTRFRGYDEQGGYWPPKRTKPIGKRYEEAIGTAFDLRTAYREGAFGDNPRPFVGWLMLVEDCEGSRSSVQDRSPHFPVFKEFNGASYAGRYNILCRKLVQEQLVVF
ncbi:MAG: hypothetical protein IPM89_15675 [Candidatus Competibacteraceae bacterium]|nr:MAG: hypothetical protein IPM89_15675 [Candidatus Competibacteraceae bacterium]